MDKEKKEGLMEKMKDFFKSENGKPVEPEKKPEERTNETPAEPAQADIDDAVLDELMAKLEGGEVQATEESIKAFCKSKNLTDEQCSQIWDVVSSALAGVENKKEPETPSGPAEEAEMRKGNGKQLSEEMIEFKKSFAAYKLDVETQNEAVAALIVENKKMSETITGIGKTIEFMKSQLDKFGSQPVDVKVPATKADDIPVSQFSKSRNEIVSILGQGVRNRELNLSDVTTYESKGVLTEQANKYFLKSISSQGGN